MSDIARAKSGAEVSILKHDYLDDAIEQYIRVFEESRSKLKLASSALSTLQKYVRESIAKTDDPEEREKRLSRALNALAATSTIADEIEGLAAQYQASKNQRWTPDVQFMVLDSEGSKNQRWTPDIEFTVLDAEGQPHRVILEAKASTRKPYFRFAPSRARDQWSTEFIKALSTTIDTVIGEASIVGEPSYISVPSHGSFSFPSDLLCAPLIQDERRGVSAVEEQRPAPSLESEQEQYWRRIRDDLQKQFSLSLDVLASLIGVAYPTLVNLGRRRPHPSTSRAVLRLHAIAKDFEHMRGGEAAAAWLSTEGAETLRRLGFDAFKRAAMKRIHGRPRASGGIAVHEEPDLGASEEG
jgi:hypothetical protein